MSTTVALAIATPQYVVPAQALWETVLTSVSTLSFCFIAWYVADIFARDVGRRTLAAIGIVILLGLTLSALDIYYGPTIWLALLVLAVIRSRSTTAAHQANSTKGTFLTGAALIAAVAFLAWPPLVQPPTDGDTMTYHLPNALSWIARHSIWDNSTHYWWYPPGSELASATLISACGLFALPVVNIAALVALGFVVYDQARTSGVRWYLALSVALALVTTHVAAIQSGDMQNDVLLAALFVATLPPLSKSINPLLITALTLTKPVGWLYAMVALVSTTSRRRKGAALILLVLAFVALRDIILLNHSRNPIVLGAHEAAFRTSIIMHGGEGFSMLASSALRGGLTDGAFFLFCFCACVIPSLVIFRGPAFASLLIFVSTPFSFENGVPQLATGASLRYGMPSIALGALAFALVAERLSSRFHWAPRGATVLLAIGTTQNLDIFWSIYRGSASTALMTVVPFVVLLVAGLLLLFRERAPYVAKGVWILALSAMTIVALDHRSQANLVAYYDDAFGERHVPTSLPSLLAHSTTPNVVADGYVTGVAEMLRADARVVDLPFENATACSMALTLDAVVYLHDVPAAQGDAVGCSAIRTAEGDLIVERAGSASRR